MTKRSPKAAAREQRKERRAQSRNDTNLHRFAEVTGAQPRHTRPVVKPLNDAQRRYDALMKACDIVFGIGPAGTGKTWFAVQRAAAALVEGTIEKIIVTRPAIEAGESLGFLPGELDEKFAPYFRPVAEAFHDAFGGAHLEALIRLGKVEARPLAYLRGSTLKGAWILADEMQNATPAQFKMLLTRLGEGSKMIINGDPTQCDLPRHQPSGLEDAVRRLRGLNRIGVASFDRSDIVRHDLTQEILEAYEDRADNDNEVDDAGLAATLSRSSRAITSAS